MKASINIISSRNKCLPLCLQNLWDSWNKDYNYPVYVYYFDDIYNSHTYRDKIHNSTPQDVRFISVPYETPSFIPKEELFYNRQDLAYARSFGIERKGYLHMCYFTSNMYNYPNTKTAEYDFIMTHDDEAGYDKSLSRDPFKQFKRSGKLFGAFKTGRRNPHQGHLDTRNGLWNLTKEFIAENHITPPNHKLQSLLTSQNAATEFHLLDWCDSYIINTSLFRTDLWKKWILKINTSGGIYRGRWGDNEIYSLFAHMIQEEIYDIGALYPETLNQGKFRNIQDFAPGVKDTSK
jgi:1-acyl-sn-glycerol-3-phosphate acyltransferase